MRAKLLISLSGFKNAFKAFAEKIKKTPLILGRNAFLLILVLILSSIIFGEFLFYKHIFLTRFDDFKTNAAPVKFEENLYSSVLKEWENRENNFNSIQQLNYSSPFQ